jgi:hypothetical protein
MEVLFEMAQDYLLHRLKNEDIKGVFWDQDCRDQSDIGS